MTTLGIWLRGLAMGAADAVPGVSGGTVAFLTGIYDRWLAVLTAVRPALWQVFRAQGFIGLWRALDGPFVVPLVLGIAMSVLTLATLIKGWLDAVPERVWGFFFGLVVAMGVRLLLDIRHRVAASAWGFFVLGLMLALWIGMQTPTAVEPALWVWPLAGAMALSAMLLPGISGSFLLLLTGLYPALITAVSDFNLSILGLFLLGGGLGILVMAHVLKWLLTHYEGPVLCLLTGVVFGALVRVWPWQATGSDGSLLLLWPTGEMLLWPLGLLLVGCIGSWSALHWSQPRDSVDR